MLELKFVSKINDESWVYYFYSFLAIQKRERLKGKFSPDTINQFSKNKKQARNLLIKEDNGLTSDFAALLFFKKILSKSLIIQIKGKKNVFL